MAPTGAHDRIRKTMVARHRSGWAMDRMINTHDIAIVHLLPTYILQTRLKKSNDEMPFY